MNRLMEIVFATCGVIAVTILIIGEVAFERGQPTGIWTTVGVSLLTLSIGCSYAMQWSPRSYKFWLTLGLTVAVIVPIMRGTPDQKVIAAVSGGALLILSFIVDVVRGIRARMKQRKVTGPETGG